MNWNVNIHSLDVVTCHTTATYTHIAIRTSNRLYLHYTRCSVGEWERTTQLYIARESESFDIKSVYT